jgi:hypothetical protein
VRSEKEKLIGQVMEGKSRMKECVVGISRGYGRGIELGEETV